MSERSRPEYYQLIRRVLVAPAIADLNKNAGEARLAYDRGRSALIAQLRVVNWSLSKVVLAEFERLALEDAIQKVEVECRTLAATQAELVARLHPSHGPCQRHHTRQGTATESDGRAAGGQALIASVCKKRRWASQNDSPLPPLD